MQIGNYRFDENLAVEILEKVGLALIVLVVTWALAKAAKWAFAKLVDNVGLFRRATGEGMTLGESLGKIVSLLIWLFGLMIILQVLGLGAVAGPIDNFLDGVVAFIPNLIGAGLIFFIGLMIAKIARDLVVTTLRTVDFDKWANRGGVDEATGNTRISDTIGTIVYAIIVIVVSIAALDVLSIAAISEPASEMLRKILLAIPNVLIAAILLGIGYLVSRFVVHLIKEVLPGLGVDRALSSSGLVSEGTRASSIIARVVQIAIILFFAIAATRLLGFPELTAILNEVLELGGQVVFGAGHDPDRPRRQPCLDRQGNQTPGGNITGHHPGRNDPERIPAKRKAAPEGGRNGFNPTGEIAHPVCDHHPVNQRADGGIFWRIDHRIIANIGQRAGLGQRMTGGADDHDILCIKLGKRDPLHRVRLAQPTDHKIKLSRAQAIHQKPMRAILDLWRGIGREAREKLYRLRQHPRRHAWQCADGNCTLLALAQGRNARHPLMDRRQAAGGMAQEHFALDGQHNTAAIALQKGDAGDLFQLFQCLGNSGLGEV